MGVGVDQPRQHGAVAQVHDPRPRRQGPARPDPRDPACDDEDVDVVQHAAAAVEYGGGANDSRFL